LEFAKKTYFLTRKLVLGLPKDFEDSKHWPKSTKLDVDALNFLKPRLLVTSADWSMGIGQIRDLVDQEELVI
jgi:hypothetical protein